MIRWIIDNQRYDRRYLENANKGAASADKEPTWSNGAWLVKIGPDGTPGKFLRATEIGLEGDADTFVCFRGGVPVKFKSDDTANAAEGDLFVDTTIQGIRVKSGLQILKEEAMAKSLDQWAAECDQPASGIADLAREFTSHGKKAVVEIHRGVSQHTNGYYNVLTTYTLNLLIGNLDWQGGMIYGAGSYMEAGGSGRPFTLGDHPNKGCEHLRSLGYPEWVMRAILSHASEITGVQPESPVEKTLVACDELAGFVTAASLVRPSKSVLDLEAASVIKRMKDKAFARQVPRDHLIRGAELMGLPLDQHVTNVIGFLRLQADALGLRGTL